MHCLSIVLTIVAISLFQSSLVWAQSDAQPADKAPADKAPEIRVEDLQGTTLTGAIVYAGRVRWTGDNVVRPQHQNWQFKIQLGKDASIKWTLAVHSRHGEKNFASHYSYAAALGRPDMKPEAIGERAVVWTFENNTLSLLRVFERGGRTVKFMLTPAGSGLGCTARGDYFQEVGKGNPAYKATRGGGYVELIGVKQVSSSCQVTKSKT